MKIFKILSEKSLGDYNIMTKINHFVSNKIILEKKLSMKNKEQLEDFVHIFFNHFHLCAENGIINRNILNSFLYMLVKENFATNLLKSESNINNILYLISLAIANINEINNNQIVETSFIQSDKNIINLSGMVSLIKLLKLTSFNLENNINEKSSNSRIRLYKALNYLKLEGVSIEPILEEFLKNFDDPNMNKFDNSRYYSEYISRVSQILDKIGVKYIKDKKFDICGVDFFIEPGICLIVNGEEDFLHQNLKGKSNFIKRYLSLQNYEVISLPYNLFDNRTNLEELLTSRFYNIITKNYERISYL